MKRISLKNRKAMIDEMERKLKNIEIEADDTPTDIYARYSEKSQEIEFFTFKNSNGAEFPEDDGNILIRVHKGAYTPSFFRKDFTGWDTTSYCELFDISETQLATDLVAAGAYSSKEEALSESLTGTAERWTKLYNYVCGVKEYAEKIKAYYASKVENDETIREIVEDEIDEMLSAL